jgi:hypothetical protein
MDPRTKQGRFVFRRGCHKQCITQVLGGCGTDPWPTVSKVPTLPNGDPDNPFIRQGEFYIAGNEYWNPFGPRFPGDGGFVNTEPFNDNPDQIEFHLFVQCSEHAHKRHWHGPDAVGGRMYVGVYKRPDDHDERVSELQFQATDLDHTNKMAIAAHKVKNDYQRYGPGKLRSGVQERHFTIAKSTVNDDSRAADKWSTLTARQKDNWAMLEFLMETNFTMYVVPVQFVRFDEALCQTLVDSGAMMTPRGRTGQVSLDPPTLRQYAQQL